MPPSSYAIIAGDLPREQVEACAGEQLAVNGLLDRDLTRDGELTVVPTTAGTVYAAWRGDHVVLGRRDDVVRATATGATSPAWLRAADVPTDASSFAMVAISTDQVFGAIIGVPTKRWKLTMDAPSKGWPERDLTTDAGDSLARFARDEARRKRGEAQATQDAPPPPPPPAPAPAFTGQLELEYATPAEATRAGETMTTAAFPMPLEENLAAALAKLSQQVTGATLTLRFDQSSFPGVELAKLQAWLVGMQQQR